VVVGGVINGRAPEILHHDHNRAECFCCRGPRPHAALLAEKDFEPWLSGEAGVELLRPAADYLLQRWPVSKRVNSSKAPADDPTLIDRIEPKAA
jgi:hypothetical protein